MRRPRRSFARGCESLEQFEQSGEPRDERGARSPTCFTRTGAPRRRNAGPRPLNGTRSRRMSVPSSPGASSLAKIRAAQGELAEAERLARDSLALVAATDATYQQGKVLLALAEVLDAADKRDEARGALDEAVVLFEREGQHGRPRNAPSPCDRAWSSPDARKAPGTGQFRALSGGSAAAGRSPDMPSAPESSARASARQPRAVRPRGAPTRDACGRACSSKRSFVSPPSGPHRRPARKGRGHGRQTGRQRRSRGQKKRWALGGRVADQGRRRDSCARGVTFARPCLRRKEHAWRRWRSGCPRRPR